MLNHIKYAPLYLYGGKSRRREISQETITVVQMRNNARREIEINRINKQTNKKIVEL